MVEGTHSGGYTRLRVYTVEGTHVEHMLEGTRWSVHAEGTRVHTVDYTHGRMYIRWYKYGRECTHAGVYTWWSVYTVGCTHGVYMVEYSHGGVYTQ